MYFKMYSYVQLHVVPPIREKILELANIGKNKRKLLY